MSKKKYRRRPGMPRTETDAMIRAAAMEMLDSALSELEMEISVLKNTVTLYNQEVTKRLKNPDAEHGRWQVAPGIGVRATGMLRRLQDRRDKMIAEAEEEILEQVEAVKQAEVAKAETPTPGYKPEPSESPKPTEAKVIVHEPAGEVATGIKTTTKARDPVGVG